MVLIDENSKILNNNDIEFLNKKCNNFILSESPVLNNNNNNFYFRQLIDLKDPLVYNIVIELESYVRYKSHINLELKKLWINKIDVNSNKDDIFHKDNSDYSLILYLNDDYIGGQLEYKDDIFNTIKIKPKKNLMVLMDNKLQHRVLPVINGVRYSLVAFFRFINNPTKNLI